jgi:putative flippase GtrA
MTDSGVLVVPGHMALGPVNGKARSKRRGPSVRKYDVWDARAPAYLGRHSEASGRRWKRFWDAQRPHRWNLEQLDYGHLRCAGGPDPATPMRGIGLLRVARFAIVGLVGAAADFAIVVVFRHAGLPLPLAVATGWGAAAFLGYLGNRSFVFAGSVAADGRRMKRRYATLAILNALLAVGGVSRAVQLGAEYLPSRICMSATLVVLNYVVCRWWIFRVDQAPLAQPRGRPSPVRRTAKGES